MLEWHRGFQGKHEHDPSAEVFPPRHIQKSTVLADAGFEILYGIDDRVFGNLEPKATVRRAGRVRAQGARIRVFSPFLPL